MINLSEAEELGPLTRLRRKIYPQIYYAESIEEFLHTRNQAAAPFHRTHGLFAPNNDFSAVYFFDVGLKQLTSGFEVYDDTGNFNAEWLGSKYDKHSPLETLEEATRTQGLEENNQLHLLIVKYSPSLDKSFIYRVQKEADYLQEETQKERNPLFAIFKPALGF